MTWVKNHHVADIESSEHDSSSNCYESVIYHDGDKLYRVEFMNGHPVPKYTSGKGYSRDDYKEPVEVLKKQRMEDYYEDANQEKLSIKS